MYMRTIIVIYSPTCKPSPDPISTQAIENRDKLPGTLAGGMRLAHAGRRNPQGFAVLGDGAASDHDALVGQTLGDLVIGKRLGAVFAGHQLADERLHRGGRSDVAAIGRSEEHTSELQSLMR